MKKRMTLCVTDGFGQQQHMGMWSGTIQDISRYRAIGDRDPRQDELRKNISHYLTLKRSSYAYAHRDRRNIV
jgi:hypothetical protein